MDTISMFYRRHKEKIRYLLFGACTTVVSIGSFAFFTRVIPVGELLANLISWLLAVLFAFFTNRRWVFSAQQGSVWKQLTRFCSGRLATLWLEEMLLFVFVTVMPGNDMAVKLIAQIIVVVLNYLVSKLFVFKK